MSEIWLVFVIINFIAVCFSVSFVYQHVKKIDYYAAFPAALFFIIIGGLLSFLGPISLVAMVSIFMGHIAQKKFLANKENQ